MPMNKNEIKEFFDKYASSWDDEMIRDDNIIANILNVAQVKKGDSILDVATGTGVLIPDYLKREVSLITGIDISDEMIKIAKSKFDKYENVHFVVGDGEEYDFKDETFDHIIIYNAFPHFNNPEKLLQNLTRFLNNNGTFVIAHGMSKEDINNHHKGAAKHISNMLIPAKELAKFLSNYLNVKMVIDSDYYLVMGRKL